MAFTKREDDIKLSESRKKYFDESKFDPFNQKYGLFSYTGTLAVSNKPYFLKKTANRGEDNKVKTKPANFLTNPTKKGKTPDAYFSLPKYQSEGNLNRKKKDMGKEKSEQKTNDSSWKPGGPLQESSSLYPHLPSDREKTFKKRAPDGSVQLEPRNFYTSPPRLGSAGVTPGLLLGPDLEHGSDPYDRKHMMIQEEYKKHKSKMGDRVFVPPNTGNRPFFDDRLTYGEVPMKKKMTKSSTQASFKQPAPFVPSSGFNKWGTIGPYLEHMPDPFISPTRKPPSEAVPWRHTTNKRTIPTPSVISNPKNLRSEYPNLKRNH